MPRANISHTSLGERGVIVIGYAAPRPPSGVLTEAEEGVARALLEGLSLRRIARQRGVAERTVANQSARIYRKLRVGSREELALRLLGPE